MNIRPLTTEEAGKLSGAMKAVFDSDMPPMEHTTFWGVFDGGEIKGFLCAEDVCHIGQIHMFDGGNAKHPIALVKHVEKEMRGKAVCLVASKEKYGKFFETLGCERIDGTLYRRG